MAGAQCAKFSLFFFNFIFLILGILLIVEGVLTLTLYKEYVDFTSDSSRGIPIALICAGIVIIIITFLGCCGAIKENYGMLRVYVSLIVVLLLVEIGAGIAGYILRGNIDQLVDENMTNLQQEYNKSSSAKRLMDSMQQGLRCCGVNNYTDWSGWVEDEPNILPASCCKVPDTTACYIIGSPFFDIYTNPCYPTLKNVLISQIGIIAGIAIGIAVIQIFGITCGCCLMKSVKKDYVI